MIGLTIAGLDPSGGAGILTDIKTFSALGIHGTSVVTNLTAQNPDKVYGIKEVDTDFISLQFDSILDAYPIEYGKTGMLYSKEIIKLVSEKINENDLKIVIDPVMVASSGANLMNNDYSKYLKKYLIPNGVLVCPNIKEAETLSGIKINNLNDGIKAAEKIGKKTNVIITGGHLNGQSILYDGDIKVYTQELIKTNNTHGSGCTFSAAVCGYLIKNYDLRESIEKSNDYVYNSIKYGRYKTLNPLYELNNL
ncbi:bifunctional hydroxymethylpyrimidine kinase/phosphomethylpyrimidine kinase [Methanobrevibacter sp. 87.7]|uniref:bifunctional hydroxymethylpyrimidine kinase/phosphomethylpyrimidine kinase n=1 Tax=Methanobrevibacter sp. 87.7 TaxID=387957 RepID=UPI000B510DF9|nr:bifunctional hydroxymethylpyrimidine kinase/phosphomethylpyrimidine kinase [Methanobrevibacter sp. 87.7]OWT32519.1 bifunctional hydroxymethylpyrimidine kinase/phosphomethylpyrimidine kinase [Methanobrevibacter sp. 87.7]